MTIRTPKPIRELFRWAKPFGWTYEIGGGGHLKWTHPNVPGVVITAHSPAIRDSAKPYQKLATAYRQATGKEMPRGRS